MAFNSKQYKASWAKKHPKKMKAAQKRYNRTQKAKLRAKRYRDTHKKERSELFRKWYLKNRKKMNRLHRKWIKNNPEKAKQIDRVQYARRKSAIGSFTLEEWNKKKGLYKFCCAMCHQRKKMTIDHIIPLSKGGTNYIKNIQPLCKSCNCSKNDRIV